jgi:ApbE superfamily uncharacterized protein (UPF0280 family)
MKDRARAALLPDGRLHLNDGPIDLVVRADGRADEVRAAYGAAVSRFREVLDELCRELSAIRSSARRTSDHLQGPIAKRMNDACAPFLADEALTPMAAVAGAVAEEILAAMIRAADLDRAFVNNGGDIAFHLTRGTALTAGLVPQVEDPALAGTARIGFEDPVRGIATSGRGGRSFSLGIADSVTVLAATASIADAAATVIGNAVDLPCHPAVKRVPARELLPDSDLGDRLVTRGVGPLSPDEIVEALDAGAGVAEELVRRGLIRSAALHLRGSGRVVPSTQALPGIALLQPITFRGEPSWSTSS